MIRRQLLLGGLGLAGLGIAGGGYAFWRHLNRPGPFVNYMGQDWEVFPDPPHQEERATPFEIRNPPYTERLFADFHLKAVVLAARRYEKDRLLPLSTMDLALGWGPMSNPRIVSEVKVTQAGRFYFWQLPAGSRLSGQDVAWHSANMHMIPANPRIDLRLATLRGFDMIELEGHLCDIHGQGGPWLSSRDRKDTGAGACEIIHVTRLKVFPS